MSFVLYQWTGNVLREDRKTCSSKPKLNDMKTLFTHFIESKSQQLKLFLHIKNEPVLYKFNSKEKCQCDWLSFMLLDT